MKPTKGAPPEHATVAVNSQDAAIELSAAQKLYEASSRIHAARAKLEDHKKQYGPEQAAYRHCENIDDDLFEALRLLGS